MPKLELGVSGTAVSPDTIAPSSPAAELVVSVAVGAKTATSGSGVGGSFVVGTAVFVTVGVLEGLGTGTMLVAVG